MKRNRIWETAQKVHLDEGARRRIKGELYRAEQEMRVDTPRCGIRWGTRVAIAAALVVSLSISALAVAHFTGLSVMRDGDGVKIEATGFEDSTAPHFAWNSGDDEISVRLEFDFMPEDMSEDGTASHKYGNDMDNTRAITFLGFDLTREDLSTFLDGIATAEAFDAGGREAYLLTGESEISVYNKDIYVLFSDLGLVVHGRAAYGLSDDELMAIATGMKVTYTDDAVLALPISNEFSVDPTVPDVFYNDRWNITREELYNMGDKAVYDGYFESWEITVEDAAVYDDISVLKDEFIDDYSHSKIDRFIDGAGNFIPYVRTRVNHDTKKFEESETVEKRLVTVTVTLSSGVGDTDSAATALQGFDLYGLAEVDGKIRPEIGSGEYAIDSTPGTVAHFHEPVYKEHLGEGRWLIGYILDEDECDGEMIFSGYYAHIDYSVTAK